VQKIPNITSLISVRNGKYQKGLVVELVMSLECFTKLVMDGNNKYINAADTTNEAKHPEQKVVEEECKKTFYEIYEPKFRSMSDTLLIDRHRYNDIVKTLLKLSAYTNDEKPTPKEKQFKKKSVAK
jgi:hypothetical protein